MKTTQIEINDRFLVEVDQYNHSLYENKTRTEGENVGTVYKKLIGYFPNISQCLKRCVYLTALDEEKQTIEQFIKRLEKLDIKL